MSDKKVSQATKKNVSLQMPRRSSLFWDVDPKTIDPKKHARYIIERILEFGRDDEVRWMWNTYHHGLIREVVDTSRILHQKTIALWELLVPQNPSSTKKRCPKCKGSGYISIFNFYQNSARRN